MREAGKTRKVTCKCGHLDGTGTFEIEGKQLVLNSNFGIKKVLLGFALPQRLAKRLLRNICEQEAAKQRAVMAEANVPAPEAIEAVAGATPTAETLGAATKAP